jgi:DNA-binding transcriptional LysR family regulator
MAFTLRHARYFTAAARAGQISRAAIDMNISQSAVTAAVKELEAILGLELFERRSDGVSLTQAGYRFLRHAEDILSAVDDAMDLGGDSSPNRLTGTVRIGMTYTVAGYFAAPFIHRTARRFPAIELALVEAERSTIERKLIDGELDLAFLLTSNLEDGERLSHRTLVCSRRRLWLPAGHDLSRQNTLRLRDLATHPYIVLNVDEAAQTQQRYWERLGVSFNVVFETSSVEAVRTMVASGMGLTVLSDMVFRPWSLDGRRIETRDLSDEVPSMDVGVVWATERQPSPASLTVRKFFQRAVAGEYQSHAMS